MEVVQNFNWHSLAQKLYRYLYIHSATMNAHLHKFHERHFCRNATLIQSTKDGWSVAALCGHV